jgi:proteasome alpha subunit
VSKLDDYEEILNNGRLFQDDPYSNIELLKIQSNDDSISLNPTKPLVEPSEKIFRINGHVGATGSVYLGDILQLFDEIQLAAQKHGSAVQVDPSGTFFRGGGFAIGQYSTIALDMIQREYNTDMSVEEAIRLGNKGIEKALGEKP